MIRSHIDSIQGCGLTLKFERLFYLSNRSFGLGSHNRLRYLSFVFSVRVDT